jgi:WD40 repeat protein
MNSLNIEDNHSNINNYFNIINEKKKDIINNINSNNIDNSQLSNSPAPNFIYQEDIISHCDCVCGLNESFDIFKSIQDNKDYLIISNKENNNIEIINFYTKEVIKVINGNDAKFILLKYYLNPKNKKEYLVTADVKSTIKIINITDNYNIISIIKCPKEFKNTWNFLNCALLFNIQINSQFEDIIIVSSRARYMEEYPTKIYNIENGLLIKDISNTNKNKTRFIIPWYNEMNKQYYIIECCENLLIIVSLLHNEIYTKLSEERFKSFSSGFVYRKNMIDYLYVSTSCSEINIWNLMDKVMTKKIKISNECDSIRLYGLLLWKENYLIVLDDTNKGIKVIDSRSNKVICHINNKHNASVRCIKRIKHKDFGECLLTAGDDNTIKLWKNMPKIIIPLFV